MMYSESMDHIERSVWNVNQHFINWNKLNKRQDETFNFNSVIPFTIFSAAALGLAGLIIGKISALLIYRSCPPFLKPNNQDDVG